MRSASPPTSAGPVFRAKPASRLDAFDGLVRDLSVWAAEARIPGPTLRDVTLLLDELFSNIVIHGYQHDPEGDILVEATIEGDRVMVTLTDHAPAFDPLQVPEPDTTLSLQARPIGGLGLLFVRRTADDLQYWRIAHGTPEAANRVRFTKFLSRGDGVRQASPGHTDEPGTRSR